MNMASEMMGTMSTGTDAMHGMDLQLMADCIEACAACEQACTMCSDACATEGMGVCASRCATCADVCSAMMRMMMRPAGMDRTAMMAMLDACAIMCRATAMECASHDNEYCQMCATVCTNCAEACEAMLASMHERA